MSIDVARMRAETPGVQNVLHLNNAGAGLMPQPVIDALHGHIDLEATIGGYEANDAALSKRNHTYDAIARLVNATRDEIALVENATVAWLQAFHAFAANLGPGDKIMTVEAEYAANVVSYLQVAKSRGIEVVVVPSDETGEVDIGRMASMIDDKVKLISITHVPTNGGLVNPAKEIGALARDAGVPYLLDACQSVGQMPIDVEDIGCDALSVTGRKYLRGPRGTGFLYVNKERLPDLHPPVMDHYAAPWTSTDEYQLHPTARRFENWEFYVAGVIGLGVAVDYALDIGLDQIQDRCDNLAKHLRDGLSGLPRVSVTDLGRHPCAIVTFQKDGLESADIKSALSAQKMNVSITQISSTRYDMERRGLDSMVRASVHYYNDEEEIDRFLSAVEAL